MRHFILRTRTLVVALVCVFSYLGIYYAVERLDNRSSVAVMASLGQEAEKVIILDAGHGGMDGGCSSGDGNVLEKGINLNILKNLEAMCRLFGYRVEVTRDKDISIHDQGVEGVGAQKRSDMDNRLELFNKYPNAVCISIHQNQFTDPKYYGAQMFYSESHPDNRRFAQLMQNSFVENLQPENTREIKACGKELYLCYYCTNPTVMVECGFLSNPEEAAKLNSDQYQKQVALTIFSGLNRFLAGESA